MLFYHRISSARNGKSPAEIVFNRKLRVPAVSPFNQGDEVWYKPMAGEQASSANYLMTKEHNASWILCNKRLTLAASNNQFAPGSSSVPEHNMRPVDAVSDLEPPWQRWYRMNW